MIKNIFILSAVIAFLGLSAQKTHTVAPKETPYGISKQYGLSIDELYQLNPSKKEGGLKIGDVLVISKTGSSTKTVTPKTTPAAVVASSGKTGTITLQPKQTVYGITKQYKISEADLRKLNPQLDSNLKIGDKITLPLDNIQRYSDSSSNVAQTTTVVETKPVAKTETAASEPAKGFYVVQAKDNYYKISKQFNLTQKQLFALNPGLESTGLKPGETIKVSGADAINVEDNSQSNTISAPVTKTVASTQTQTAAPSASSSASGNTSTSEDDYVTYTVQSGDTMFSIMNHFNVTLDQLISLNPNLVDGLKAGMTLKIKKQDPMYSKKAGDVLSVVLMLPFGFDANDAKYRTMSMDFLTGAKLAAERNAKNGQKLDIKVVDAGNENTFKNSLSQINQDNTDLIVGPFFKSSILEVLNYVKQKSIPVVAPFANSPDLFDYSNLIIIETENSVYSDRIVKEVSQVYQDQKIYIVADNSKANANAIKAGLDKSLSKANVVIVNSSSDIQLENNMMTGQSVPVIAVLADDDESAGSAFASKIIALGKQTDGVKAFSMFYSPSFEKNVDDLSKASLVYLMDRKINYDGDFEKEILAAYKAKYCKTPSKYAVIGFDVMNDMLTRENKKGEIFKQINKSQTQLATKFEFVKAKPNGAYINNGYRVVRLMQ
ncbi:LysM peptidoglycan-binding domain-containing protein [Epilithonimonas sp. JDS]|uniref:LysM peptidoglycan-binding domain-containing protein n=1 Tax=Epilithonimonas sp. JDS TaxID=2902797 RepID=UPI001E4F8D64|nr:LysM peptidoglycan-binding domain-containing protein [Epilithonimonas sp. JDS]MCD9854143.1 LysM peptidoglycan-binding domain-containing protein [Epilithonimonas sp. JDS]